MAFKVIDRKLNGLILLEPDFFRDERGFFMESYRKNLFSEIGIDFDFVQENHSRSIKSVLRGMHFQWNPPQGKLLRVTFGSAFVAEIDIRKDSPTFGEYASFELSAENKRMLWVPAGFANGFFVLSDFCEMQYKCTAYWNKNGEGSILWNDKDVNINWPSNNPVLSEKDRNGMSLKQWKDSDNSFSL